MSCTYTCSWSITRRMFPFGSYCGRKILSCCTSLKFDFLMHLKCCNLYIFLEVGLNYFQLGTTKELIPEEMWLRLVEWPGYLELVLVSARKFTEEARFQNLVYPKNWKARILCQFSVTKMIPENWGDFLGICNTISNISPLAIGVKSSQTWDLRYGGGPALPRKVICMGRDHHMQVGRFHGIPPSWQWIHQKTTARWNCTLH